MGVDSTLLLQSHVVISLIAILSGLVVLWSLLQARVPGATTLIFLVTTAATSITGFFFHRDHLLPSHIVGIVALVVMLPTLLAIYAFHLRGAWRPIYVIGAIVSLWFNVFVLIAQSFLKVPALHDLAPTGSEPPFAIAQGVVFVIFIALTVLALRRNRRTDILPARL
jgi:hypothetical protein